jgi:hypothetical protein
LPTLQPIFHSLRHPALIEINPLPEHSTYFSNVRSRIRGASGPLR